VISDKAISVVPNVRRLVELPSRADPAFWDSSPIFAIPTRDNTRLCAGVRRLTFGLLSEAAYSDRIRGPLR